jgi:hypothetical protein
MGQYAEGRESVDRKYRHSGYQDRTGSGGERSSGGGAPFLDERPQRLEGAPKGRGAERNREDVFRCKSCGTLAEPDFGPDAVCAKCGAALHACVQCAHFDTLSRYQCRKPIERAILGKTKRNDCALFSPTIVLDLRGKSAVDTPDQARSAFDKLFGKK